MGIQRRKIRLQWWKIMENLNGKMGEIFENAGFEWDYVGVLYGM